MKIYTRTGDTGTTTLFGGKRVSKSDIQIESYGTIDELTSFIGLLITKTNKDEDKKLLTNIQKDLHDIMAILSGAKINLTLGERVKKFEQKIDSIQSKLPELHGFILPQGTEIACFFHIARTICRRAERNTIGYFKKLKIENSMKNENCKLKIYQYLNRLSDLLFAMARSYNTKEIMI
jgi:cob(I)alamin adenosyltransferase